MIINPAIISELNESGIIGFLLLKVLWEESADGEEEKDMTDAIWFNVFFSYRNSIVLISNDR